MVYKSTQSTIRLLLIVLAIGACVFGASIKKSQLSTAVGQKTLAKLAWHLEELLGRNIPRPDAELQARLEAEEKAARRQRLIELAQLTPAERILLRALETDPELNLAEWARRKGKAPSTVRNQKAALERKMRKATSEDRENDP